jgi:hypothetical protein
MRLDLQTDHAPGARELSALVDAAAWATARWAAVELEAGRDPPCCLGCAGLLYLPDAPSADLVRLRTGAALLAGRTASCGEVVAYQLGKLRAQRGRAGLEDSGAGWPVVEPRGAGRYHAVIRMPDGTVWDPCDEMMREGTVR